MPVRKKKPADDDLKRRVQELIAVRGGGHNADLVADIIENALKLLTDVEHRGDVRVIQSAIRAIGPAMLHRTISKVTIARITIWTRSR